MTKTIFCLILQIKTRNYVAQKMVGYKKLYKSVSSRDYVQPHCAVSRNFNFRPSFLIFISCELEYSRHGKV